MSEKSAVTPSNVATVGTSLAENRAPILAAFSEATSYFLLGDLWVPRLLPVWSHGQSDTLNWQIQSVKETEICVLRGLGAVGQMMGGHEDGNVLAMARHGQARPP